MRRWTAPLLRALASRLPNRSPARQARQPRSAQVALTEMERRDLMAVFTVAPTGTTTDVEGSLWATVCIYYTGFTGPGDPLVITFDYATVDGTAQAGSDYTAVSGTATLDWTNAGVTISVPTTDDTLPEPSETFSIRISNVTGAVPDRDEADFTILDNDSPAPTTTTVRVDPGSPVVEGEVFELEAAVAPVSPYSGQPTGDVVFTATNKATSVVRGLGSGTLGVDLHPEDRLWEAELLVTEALPPGEYIITATYQGNSLYSSSSKTTMLTVNPSPEIFAPLAGCVCAGPFVTGGGGTAPSEPTAGGILPGSGRVQLTTTALPSGGAGLPLSQTTVWSNSPTTAGGVAGNGTSVADRPYLFQLNGENSLAVVTCALTAYPFDKYDDRYHPRGGGSATLTHDPVAHRYYVTDGAGNRYTFYDFSLYAPLGRDGQLVLLSDAAGTETAVTSWTAAGQPAEVQTSTGAVSDEQVESYVYAYYSGGAADGLLETVTQRRRTGTGAWETVGTVAYTYHDGTTAAGRAGDLRTVAVSDASGVTDTTYYRYYTAAGSGGGSGDLSLVKFALRPAAYARLTAALGTGVDALTDGQVDDYADLYLAYDAEDRVVTAVAAGDGCSVCSAGQGTYAYAYAANPSPSGLRGPNEWAWKTTETRPDGTVVVTYTNAAGQTLLAATTPGGWTGAPWVTYNRYDDAGRVVLTASPSAVTGYDDGYGDLVHYVSGNAEYLEDTAGLLTAYTYASATTATTSTAGDVAGFQKGVDLLHGETATLGNGRRVPQSSQTYLETPAGTFVSATSTAYRNADGTGAQTTTTSYTWQGSTAQPASVTVTDPVVSAGQNGSGTATASTTVYDAFGRPIWVKDAGGFLTYTEYDRATGAVARTIADVDTTQTSAFADLPSGWSTPSGGGLHLTTTYEVDAKGRTTKMAHPGGGVDYTVYDDAAHETRYYPGWNSSTNTPTGPTTVTREDRANGYTETLTMSAAPAVSSGRPTGAESIAAVQSLSRSYVNSAGQVTHTDAYFDLGGLAYSTSVTLGTEGVNFDRTRYAYTHQGWQNKVVTPAGTITRTEYDGLGRAVSEWVGTDDTPTTGFWSTTNLTGTNMVKVREYEYDGGGVGDGNVTRTTEYPGLSIAARVAETYYDWRNRAVATKSGVETTESTGVNRPITYTDYDNLGQVIRTRVYDGDGVSVTSTAGVPNAPSSSLLRAKSEVSYDDLGRVYRTDTFSVDPSAGSVGSYTLNSQTWYDARGQVVKSSEPGGLVSKAAYDGLGRVTTSYLTDGGGDTGYADADDVTGDTVLAQTETTYDAAGNAVLSVTRDRFHDASGTGVLGSPSSGVGARVSYVATYYDGANRLVASVNVGTNGGSAWTRPGSVPTRSDAVLVTSVEYAADAVQTVRLTGAPTGGTFTLTFGGNTTSGIAYNASAATVQTALEGLASVGSGNVVVTAATGGGWQVRFAGTLAGKYQVRLTASGAGLTGGTAPAVAVSTVSAGGDVGRAAAVTDPAGRVRRTYADALGRTTQTVEHFTDGAVADTSNKTTHYTYGAAGMTSLTAALTGGGGQTTAWVYGVTAGGGSGLDSNDLVGATRWPDATTGTASSAEQETVTVNSLGQTVTSTDRNGTTHTLTYDVLGRVTADAVTTLGSGVDGAVRRIETAYDGRGNPYLVTSYNAATSGSIVNQVQRGYNGLGQLTAEWQAHAGAVNTSTTPAVTYTYSEMPSGANHSRLTAVTYPSGYSVGYSYASGLDATVSRLSALTDAGGTLEAYSYLGLGAVVVRSHPQPDLDLTHVKRSGESNGDAGDQYTGLDRFGRVVDQRWVDGSSGTATDRFQYGYDRAGNRLYRDNLVNATFGEVYTYDGLNQLASFDRGTLNGTKTGLTGSSTRSQDWDYDAVGNWDGIDVDGVTQARTANAQNEVTSIGSLTTPTYDANGNMTRVETGLRYVYDAWNRLVAVKDSTGATTLETLGYDGLNRRVATAGGTTADLFYSAGWQVLEERVGGATTQRYVWSPVYVDALVLRDRDTDANGSLDERLWVQQDANWNVMALVDGTGAVVERFVYDPFGAVTIYSPTYTVRSGSSYGWTQGFQGMFFDSVSGLDLSRGRPGYSPTQGRWISVDPTTFGSGDVNLYRGFANSPVMLIDPMGLNVCFSSISVSAGGGSMVPNARPTQYRTLGAHIEPSGVAMFGFQVEVRATVSGGDKITDADVHQKVSRVSARTRRNGTERILGAGNVDLTRQQLDTWLAAYGEFSDDILGIPALPNTPAAAKAAEFRNTFQQDADLRTGVGGLFTQQSPNPRYAMYAATPTTITWADFPGVEPGNAQLNAMSLSEYSAIFAFQITAIDKGGEMNGKKIVAEFSILINATSNGQVWTASSPTGIYPTMPKTWTAKQ